MKTIVTGMRGTVAPVLAQALQAHGHTVIAWDREQVPAEDPSAVQQFLATQQPDWVFHVATGSAAWAEQIARICYLQGTKLLFTGSVSAFGAHQRAPLAPTLPPEPSDDYGRYKLECEQRVQVANPATIVARLAWQIGDSPDSNTMVRYITTQIREHGAIHASRHWFPACAFLHDTAEGLVRLMETYSAGIYHLDGNPGLSFYEIVTRLDAAFSYHWPIIPADEPAFNNQMHDPRFAIGPITSRM